MKIQGEATFEIFCPFLFAKDRGTRKGAEENYFSGLGKRKSQWHHYGGAGVAVCSG